MKYLLLLILIGCSSAPPKPRERGALKDLVLRADPKVPGQLVSACASCEVKRQYFDLTLEADRIRLIDAQMICMVGMKRFRVCRILEGLCHQTVTESGWGPWKKQTITLIEFIDATSEHQKLVDLGAICAAQGSIAESEFFTED